MEPFSIILTIIMLLMGAILALCLFTYLRHKILCFREKRKYSPPGNLVDVGGNKLHVVVKGEKEPTILLMASSGTCAPELDFRHLSDRLSSLCRTVVCEAPGSGYSEDTRRPRSVDVLVNDTRQALQKSGITPPYILCPHSMAALEAIWWSAHYSEEVHGIIGLDMALPEMYRHAEISRTGTSISRVLTRLGMLRYIPQLLQAQPSMTDNTMSEQERGEFAAHFWRHGTARATLRTAREVWNNAMEVETCTLSSELPILLFSSNGKFIELKDDVTWIKIQRDFCAAHKNARLVELDCDHYVHRYKPDIITDTIRDWLKSPNTVPRQN